jgi:hypothetical protein
VAPLGAQARGLQLLQLLLQQQRRRGRLHWSQQNLRELQRLMKRGLLLRWEMLQLHQVLQLPGAADTSRGCTPTQCLLQTSARTATAAPESAHHAMRTGGDERLPATQRCRHLRGAYPGFDGILHRDKLQQLGGYVQLHLPTQPVQQGFQIPTDTYHEVQASEVVEVLAVYAGERKVHVACLGAFQMLPNEPGNLDCSEYVVSAMKRVALVAAIPATLLI